MIRINQIKLKYNHGKDALAKKILSTLKIKENELVEYKIVKKSIDAREKPDFKFVYGVNVVVKNENNIKKSIYNNNVFKIEEEKYNYVPAYSSRSAANFETFFFSFGGKYSINWLIIWVYCRAYFS